MPKRISKLAKQAKPLPPTKMHAFRMEPGLIADLDRIAGKLSAETGLEVNRTAALRACIVTMAKRHGVHEPAD